MEYQNVIFLFIAIVAFLGNSLTVILFIKRAKWLKKTFNCLILALAIQDILLAVCLVVLPGLVLTEDAYTLPSDESSRPIYCKIIWSRIFPFVLGIASVYTCLMLTLDRWIAVVKPLSYETFAQSKFVIFCILFPWIAGMCFQIPPLLNITPIEVNGTAICRWRKQDLTSNTIFLAVFSFLGAIVIPTTLMVLAYCQIIFHMKRSQDRIGAGRYGRSLKKVTVTAFLASTVIIVCWLPDNLYYLTSQINLTEFHTPAHSVVMTLAFANSCVNPFIYCLSNNSYRNALKEMFGCLCPVRNANVSR